MPYGRLYDDLHKHKKTRRALSGGERPRDASTMGLWVLANSWCIENYGTDGWVPAWELEGWDSDAESLSARLVEAGYWIPETVDGEPGFRFADWLDRQKSGQQIDAEKEAARERMARVRANSKRTTAARSAQVHDVDTDTDKKNTPARKRAETDPDFEAFWSEYPRKTAKAAAAKAYAKARKTTDADALASGLRASVAHWTATRTEPQYVPHATTWLNQGRWEDDTQATIPTPEQTRRVTLMQCASGDPHGRHQWEDGPNLCHCQGVAA